MEIADRGRKREHGSLVFSFNNRPPPLHYGWRHCPEYANRLYLVSNGGLFRQIRLLFSGGKVIEWSTIIDRKVTFPFPRENIDFWQLSREILSTRRQTREVNVERFDIFVTQPLLQRLQSMLHSAINAPTNLGQQFILPQRCHTGCIPATVVPRYCYTSNNKSSIWQRSFSNQWERVKRRVYFANIAFYISKRGRKGKKWDRDRTLGT